SRMSSDHVATWTLSLPDGKHKVEFEHGTTSGKRVGSAKCTVSIDACSGFAYEYTLEVNGKPLEKFRDNQNKIQKCWCFTMGSQNSTPFRVVLEKDTLNVWVNGKVVETTAVSSGKRRDGIIHKLFVDDQEIPPAHE
ncbi:FAIM1-like protein, partial [Mya arenaria]